MHFGKKLGKHVFLRESFLPLIIPEHSGPHHFGPMHPMKGKFKINRDASFLSLVLRLEQTNSDSFREALIP